MWSKFNKIKVGFCFTIEFSYFIFIICVFGANLRRNASKIWQFNTFEIACKMSTFIHVLKILIRSLKLKFPPVLTMNNTSKQEPFEEGPLYFLREA